MLKGVKKYISRKKNEQWWNERRQLAKKTEGMKEGIKVREELAGAFYNEGVYEDSAKMYEEAAMIAEKYPETEKNASKYFEVAAVIREEMSRRMNSESERQRSNLNIFLVLAASMGIIFGILLLTPNFTGSVIASPDIGITNWTGTVLLTVGIIIAIWYMKR